MEVVPLLLQEDARSPAPEPGQVVEPVLQRFAQQRYGRWGQSGHREENLVSCNLPNAFQGHREPQTPRPQAAQAQPRCQNGVQPAALHFFRERAAVACTLAEAR
jgi:hypothetical protein